MPAAAQRIEAIGKEPALKINGAVSVNQVGYLSAGIPNRRDPYTLFATASLNLDIYGWVIPFSFSYSNQTKGSFQQPFNQYALHPSYKWITTHIGYQSMSLSSYTVNGHLFSGVGVDLAPEGKWKLSALGGRFQKAVNVVPDVVSSSPVEPAYRRMGYGVKVSYGAKDQYDVILFKAKDAVNSLTAIPKDKVVRPQDNLVMGFNFRKSLGKRLLLNGELGVSALTNDLRAAKDSGTNTVPDLGTLLHTNTSTALYKAFKTGLQYNLGKAVVGLGYERIDPEYKTLGAYYFTNDVENITGTLSTRLLKDKVSLALNAGMQRNDLKKDKQSTMKRFVGAGNVSIALNKKLSLTTTYSNFQSFVNIRSTFNDINQLTPYDNLDTLNYTQVSQNAAIGANYIIQQSKERSSSMNVNVSYLTTADKQGGKKQASGGQFYNFNGSYVLNWVPQRLAVTIGLNANQNHTGAVKAFTWGPTAGVNRSFWDKKLRSGVALSWNRSQTEGQAGTRIINTRFNNTLALKKKHNLNVSLVHVNRSGGRAGLQASRNFSEYTATVGYNYNF
jgi:hypothetical protein